MSPIRTSSIGAFEKVLDDAKRAIADVFTREKGYDADFRAEKLKAFRDACLKDYTSGNATADLAEVARTKLEAWRKKVER